MVKTDIPNNNYWRCHLAKKTPIVTLVSITTCQLSLWYLIRVFSLLFIGIHFVWKTFLFTYLSWLPITRLWLNEKIGWPRQHILKGRPIDWDDHCYLCIFSSDSPFKDYDIWAKSCYGKHRIVLCRIRVVLICLEDHGISGVLFERLCWNSYLGVRYIHPCTFISS